METQTQGPPGNPRSKLESLSYRAKGLPLVAGQIVVGGSAERPKNGESPIQLLDYMSKIKNTILPDGYEVEGMIISPEADPTHVKALREIGYPGRTQWLVCNMQLQQATGSVPPDDVQ